MAFYPIPDNPEFNVTQVERVKPTDPVVDTHINPYFQTLLNNDQYLKKKEENDVTLLNRSLSLYVDQLRQEIAQKLDGDGTVTDYDEAITIQETGKVPDCTIIGMLYRNFLAGCRKIARAITGGRDGQGTGGVATADTASPDTMAANIKKLAQQNYNAGIDSVTGTAPSFSGTYSSATPGSTSNYIVRATSDGYITNGTQANTVAATTSPEVASTATNTVATLDVKPGFYNKIKVNLKNAYDAGTNAIKAVLATFTNSFTSTVAGDTSKLQITCNKSGYTENGTVVKEISAGINSTAIKTGGSKNTAEQVAIPPGVYNKIKINNEATYNAGYNAAKVGNATAEQVLEGYTFTNASTVGGAGGMTNRGAISKTFTPGITAQTYTVQKGFHSGSGVVTCSAVSGKKTLAATDIGTNVDMNGAYRYVDAHNVYDAGVASVKVARKLTLTASQTGSNVDIADNWYTTCDASAVYDKGKSDGIAYADGRVNSNSASYRAFGNFSIKRTETISDPGSNTTTTHQYTVSGAKTFMIAVRMAWGFIDENGASANNKISLTASGATLTQFFRNNADGYGMALYRCVQTGDATYTVTYTRGTGGNAPTVRVFFLWE